MYAPYIKDFQLFVLRNILCIAHIPLTRPGTPTFPIGLLVVFSPSRRKGAVSVAIRDLTVLLSESEIRATKPPPKPVFPGLAIHSHARMAIAASAAFPLRLMMFLEKTKILVRIFLEILTYSPTLLHFSDLVTIPLFIVNVAMIAIAITVRNRKTAIKTVNW